MPRRALNVVAVAFSSASLPRFNDIFRSCAASTWGTWGVTLTKETRIRRWWCAEEGGCVVGSEGRHGVARTQREGAEGCLVDITVRATNELRQLHNGGKPGSNVGTPRHEWLLMFWAFGRAQLVAQLFRSSRPPFSTRRNGLWHTSLSNNSCTSPRAAARLATWVTLYVGYVIASGFSNRQNSSMPPLPRSHS